MNVGIFSDTYLPKIDGVSVSLDNLIKEFDDKGVGYDLYVPFIPECTKRHDVYRFRSLPLIFQPEVRLSVTLDVRNLKRAFTSNYDVIHSHSPGSLGILAMQVALAKGRPHFHTVHTYFPDYTHYIFNGKVLKPQAVNKLYAFWLNRIDNLIAPSNKVRLWLEEIGVRSSIKVIPSGIDVRRFNLEKKSDYLIRNGFVGPSDKVILTAGRIASEKSFDLLLKYFSKLVTEDSGVKLVIAGDGPEKSALSKLTNQLGIEKNVRFIGYVEPSQMPEVYNSADVFALQSRSETQGMVVVEALASGLPLLITDDSAYEGMVVEGKNGYFADDEKTFVARATQLLREDDLRGRFAQESRALGERFSLEDTSKEILKFYREGMSNYKGGNTGGKFANFSLEWARTQMHIAYTELKDKLR